MLGENLCTSGKTSFLPSYSDWSTGRRGRASVKQLGCRGLPIVLGAFPVKLSRQNVGVKLLVIVL